ncbi:MAG: hypothetical protein ACM34M_14185 [Ignavibacteria bacterium]
MAKKVEDLFEIYYAEKLWEMIPSIYRHEDGVAENPGVLRSVVEVLAEQAAILRRSHDRLWDDQFIDLCDDWAVPYIADLLGTRLVSALNKRGRRIDVAKTIYYRRRKGTLRVLEELISDITGWEGKVVENFRRLGRTRHGLDPMPESLAGHYSTTLPGGWADLRQQKATELTNGPFDEFYHTADIRQHCGNNGRYGIPKLAFFLYRLEVFGIEGVTPFISSDGKKYTFDPSGRDIPLFMPRNRLKGYDWDTWHSAKEWELPAAINCNLLNQCEFQISEKTILTLISNGISAQIADELRLLKGQLFKSEGQLKNILLTFSNAKSLLNPNNISLYNKLLSLSIIDDCGKNVLLPIIIKIEENPATKIEKEQILAANLTSWSLSTQLKRLAIDPERGRFIFLNNPPQQNVEVSYYYGFSGEIGAGTYERIEVEDSDPNNNLQGGGALPAASILNDGVNQINDSKTYGPVGNKIQIKNLVLQAANRHRPYLHLEANWILSTGNNTDSTLTLEGLWIGGNNDREIILRGDYETVILSHTTIDPGGDIDANGNPILPISLVVEAEIEQLIIDSCITGPIFTRNNGIVEKLIINDSIIQSIKDNVYALSFRKGEVEMKQVTVLGAIKVHRLQASEVLIGSPNIKTEVDDTQNGCFRFGAALKGSRLPKPYESHFFEDSNNYFTSWKFGQPGYAQLSQSVPKGILRGAEDGSEIGAFSKLINPIKLDSLKAKVEEYMPFSLTPIFIQEN